MFLCTHQGVTYLEAQIRSILTQTVPVHLWVSDDGSDDGTRELVRNYEARDERVRWLEGPEQGFVANFLSVFEHPGVSDYGFLAFADQDDVWDPDKIARAHAHMGPEGAPMLYGSATRLIGIDGRIQGVSAPRPRPLSFANALVESFAGGNTMVLNHMAIQWVTGLRASLGELRDHWVSHDWMLYLVMTLAEHAVVYDPDPSMGYRQHASNLIGGNRRLGARLSRGWRLLSGQFREMVGYNEVPLRQLRQYMTPQVASCFDAYLEMQESTGLRRVASWGGAGLYRQHWLDQAALLLAFSLRRFL